MKKIMLKTVKTIKDKTTGHIISSEKTITEVTPRIKRVIFNKPATIVFWTDNTKTIVKCQEGDTYNEETGLALAISKKMLGKKDFYNSFNNYCYVQEKKTMSEGK